MDNREFAKVLLCEATELLSEASNHGAKGTTLLNNMKSQEFADLGYSLNSQNKLNKYVTDKQIDKYEKAIENKDSKKLEKIGKDARKMQKNITTGIHVAAKLTKDPIMNDSDYQDGVKGFRDTKPIKDKEEMRKNNIKLGYQIAKNYSDARKKSQNESIAILLTEAALLLND